MRMRILLGEEEILNVDTAVGGFKEIRLSYLKEKFILKIRHKNQEEGNSYKESIKKLFGKSGITVIANGVELKNLTYDFHEIYVHMLDEGIYRNQEVEDITITFLNGSDKL